MEAANLNASAHAVALAASQGFAQALAHPPLPATQELFRQDAYMRACRARLLAVREGGALVLDQTVFYPLGGGQGGDAGSLLLPDGTEIAIADTRKGKHPDGSPNGEIWHYPAQELREKLSNLEQLIASGQSICTRRLIGRAATA
jgi:misacylated tRNA(Ala) deacylase